MSEFTASAAERGRAQSGPHSHGAEFGIVRSLPAQNLPADLPADFAAAT
ncbi:hypothetical protein [Nocardia beijingensis]|nr:hypothetical protein [Nocardia beijingensis]MBF6077115.1 hypothetical protein [Nocardia beijingensis]